MDVKVVKHEAWAEVVLNRPEVKNAITGPLGLELAQAFEIVQNDDDIQVVLFRGAGGAFCSGLDLKAFGAEPSPAWMKTWKETWRRAHRAIFDCSKPIVCALKDLLSTAVQRSLSQATFVFPAKRPSSAWVRLS